MFVVFNLSLASKLFATHVCGFQPLSGIQALSHPCLWFSRFLWPRSSLPPMFVVFNLSLASKLSSTHVCGFQRFSWPPRSLPFMFVVFNLSLASKLSSTHVCGFQPFSGLQALFHPCLWFFNLSTGL